MANDSSSPSGTPSASGGQESDSNKPDTVAYDTYRKVLSEKKKRDEENEKLQLALKEFETKEKERVENELKAKGDLQKLLDLQKQEKAGIEAKLKEKEFFIENQLKVQAFKAEVKGLDQIPADEQPPVAITHYAFQIMVGIGTLLMLISLGYFILLLRKKSILDRKWLLKLFVIAIPLGYIALEAGWVVTEVGRQPWIIYGIMRTRDAVTPMPGIAWSFYLFSVIYASLNVIVIFLLYRQIKMVPVLYNQPQVSLSVKAK